jgi:hypothetical protein
MSGMPEPTDKPSSTEPSSSASGDPRAGRRRLLQGALASAPVLMTLVSRPVLAQQCTTPSGFVSANASTAGRGVVCTGRTADYWKNTSAWTSSWPSPSYQPTTLFDSVFAHNSTYYPGRTLRDVLDPQVVGAGSPNDVARAIVAALLNAQAGYTPPLSVTAVKGIWSEFITTGSFSPSSGVHWNANDIIAYLQTTQPL